MDVAEDTRPISETVGDTLPVGAVAEELGVTVGYLRLAERLGIVPEPKRSPGGHRRYSPEDIERLRRLGVGERKRRLAEGDE